MTRATRGLKSHGLHMVKPGFVPVGCWSVLGPWTPGGGATQQSVSAHPVPGPLPGAGELGGLVRSCDLVSPSLYAHAYAQEHTHRIPGLRCLVCPGRKLPESVTTLQIATTWQSQAPRCLGQGDK